MHANKTGCGEDKLKCLLRSIDLRYKRESFKQSLSVTECPPPNFYTIAANNRRRRYYVFRSFDHFSSVRPLTPISRGTIMFAYWRDFNETWSKHSLCETLLLKTVSRVGGHRSRCSWWEMSPSTRKFGQNWPSPLKTPISNKYSLVAPQPSH